SRVPAPIACGRRGCCPISAVSSNRRSSFSNQDLHLVRRQVSQESLRHQLSRSVLPPLRRQLFRRMRRSPGMKAVAKTIPPPQSRPPRAWNRKWPIRCSQRRSSSPPTCRCPPAPWHRGLVHAHLPRRIVERFCDLIAVSLMAGPCKHRALCGPATTTFRSYLGNVSCWYPGTVSQPTRFKSHSASGYRTALANWSASLTHVHARFTDL